MVRSDNLGNEARAVQKVEKKSRTSRKRDASPRNEQPPSSADAAPKRKAARFSHNDDDVDTEHGINTAIARMNGPLLADLIAGQTKRFAPELSMLELEDLRVPESAFADTSGWGQLRSLENLPPFLEHFSQRSKKSLSQGSEALGTPHTLVIAGAGLRAADLARALRVYQTQDVKVAKLFAKHIKLKEAIEFAKSTRISIGVGTPQRILDLLDQGAISLDKLERIVIDGSHVDQKKRGIMDMRETEVPLARLLGRREVKQRLGHQASVVASADHQTDNIALLVF